jgi:hypothetical protein
MSIREHHRSANGAHPHGSDRLLMTVVGATPGSSRAGDGGVPQRRRAWAVRRSHRRVARVTSVFMNSAVDVHDFLKYDAPMSWAKDSYPRD